MRKLRVLALMNETLVPPDTLEGYTDEEVLEWKTEFDVVHTLREMGHDTLALGVSDDLGVIRRALLKFKPHIVFNLLEEFHGVAIYDQNVVSYLELMRQPYTGCNPRGLMLAHDKALTKQLLGHHRIPTPKFAVFPRRRAIRRPKRLKYPLLVKSVNEEASLGISQASIVHNDARLKDRVRYVHESVNTDALVEEYIEGRELYVGVIGNQRLETFPVWELLFENLPDNVANIATRRVKWDEKYQKKLGVKTDKAKNLPAALENEITRLCKRTYKSLHMSGFARIDLRLGTDDKMYLLEANPNPNLSYGEDFAESAETIGISYEELLQRIMNLGLNYRAPWRETLRNQ